MKYLIDNIVINANQIVMVKYSPNTDRCAITLRSMSDPYDYNGNPTGVAESTTIELSNQAAVKFWEAYSRDAYVVVPTSSREASQ